MVCRPARKFGAGRGAGGASVGPRREPPGFVSLVPGWGRCPVRLCLRLAAPVQTRPAWHARAHHTIKLLIIVDYFLSGGLNLGTSLVIYFFVLKLE